LKIPYLLLGKTRSFRIIFLPPVMMAQYSEIRNIFQCTLICKLVMTEHEPQLQCCQKEPSNIWVAYEC
jgi:hypothetical protein